MAHGRMYTKYSKSNGWLPTTCHHRNKRISYVFGLCTVHSAVCSKHGLCAVHIVLQYTRVLCGCVCICINFVENNNSVDTKIIVN